MVDLHSKYKYRSVWMGIAIIWIIYYHLIHDYSIINPLLLKLQLYGYAGVDIFVFASGIGCYYSLRKNPSGLGFIIRRAKRIIPSYWLFLIPWSIIQVLKNDISPLSILGNYLGIQYLTGQGIALNWYIGFMVITYMLAPFLFEGLSKVSPPGERRSSLFSIAALLAGSFLITIPFIGSRGLLILVSRIPLFVIGMIFGKIGAESWPFEKKCLAIVSLAGITATAALYLVDKFNEDLLWDPGLGWYLFAFIAPFLCLLISLACERLQRFKVSGAVIRALSFLGDMSFELFLSHLIILDIRQYLSQTGRIPENQWWIVVVFSIPVAYLGRKLSTIISGRIFGRPFGRKNA